MPKRFFETVLLIKHTCLVTEEEIRKEFRLTQAELNGLIAIGPGENISGNEYSVRMGLSPSRGSRVLANLVRKGCLSSIPIPENRRRVTIALTAKGLQLKDALEEKMEACGEKLLTRLTAKQREQILKSTHLFEKAFESKP